MRANSDRGPHRLSQFDLHAYSSIPAIDSRGGTYIYSKENLNFLSDSLKDGSVVQFCRQLWETNSNNRRVNFRSTRDKVGLPFPNGHELTSYKLWSRCKVISWLSLPLNLAVKKPCPRSIRQRGSGRFQRASNLVLRYWWVSLPPKTLRNMKIARVSKWVASPPERDQWNPLQFRIDPYLNHQNSLGDQMGLWSSQLYLYKRV